MNPTADNATCIALRRFASERGRSIEEAAAEALRDWLIGHGYMDLEHVLDEDTETVGGSLRPKQIEKHERVLRVAVFLGFEKREPALFVKRN